MGAVFSRSLQQTYPVAARASGMYIYDETGKAYLDMCGGAAVSCLGHSHPTVLEAVHKQLEEMAFAHTAFFSNSMQEKLASLITARFAEAGARVYFTAGGSEANETALKMAWQYWRSKGQPTKRKIISREHSYHGNTLGVLSACGNAARRQTMDGLLLEWPRIEPCYAYRHQAADETDLEYGLRAANALEEAILSAGADTVAAFIAEPVVGASLGAVVAAEGYWARIREICDEHDILLIADEVMCGTGRTGSFFAHEQDGFLPDIVTMAKGIGGGYAPLAATLVRRKMVEEFSQPGSGFDHGHTYVGHATSCAAGVAVVDAIAKNNLLERVKTQGEKLQQALEASFAEKPFVGEIRGRGLFRAIEFVADRKRKYPIENSAAVAAHLKAAAMEHGLMVYPGGGSEKAGVSCHILIAPPFIVEDSHIEEMTGKLEIVLNEVFGG